jgi:hypothetical protein
MDAVRSPGEHRMRLALAAVIAAIAALPLSTSATQNPAPATDRPTYPYFIDTGRPATTFRPGDRQLAEWALAAWQRSVSNAFELVAAPEDAALIRVYWAEASDGQYGEMRAFMSGGRRGAAVYIRPDTTALGDAIARRADRDPLLRDSIVYLTCLHELGHALGLSHTSNLADVMYFFGYGVGDVVDYFGRYRALIRTRGDIANVSGLSDNDVTRLRTLYAPR